jgi:hypothetical protein
VINHADNWCKDSDPNKQFALFILGAGEPKDELPFRVSLKDLKETYEQEFPDVPKEHFRTLLPLNEQKLEEELQSLSEKTKDIKNAEILIHYVGPGTTLEHTLNSKSKAHAKKNEGELKGILGGGKGGSLINEDKFKELFAKYFPAEEDGAKVTFVIDACRSGAFLTPAKKVEKKPEKGSDDHDEL